MDGFRVLVLRLLDQKHHQKGNDGGSRVDHQLPGIRIMTHRAGDQPNQDGNDRDNERRRAAGGSGRPVGEPLKRFFFFVMTNEFLVCFYPAR